jgi:hypothetical protein
MNSFVGTREILRWNAGAHHVVRRAFRYRTRQLSVDSRALEKVVALIGTPLVYIISFPGRSHQSSLGSVGYVGPRSPE